MDRRTFLKMSMGAAGALALQSCSSTPKPAGNVVAPGASIEPAFRPTIRQTNGFGVGDLGLPNPFNYLSGAGAPLVANVWDTLLVGSFPFSKSVRPWLASSFSRAPDGLSYTFELRENIRWHDGKPLTADDVAFTFEYFAAKRPLLPADLLGQHEGVTVRVTGPRSFEFHLEKPNLAFEKNVLTFVSIVPRHIWASVDDPAKVQDQSILMGSGPYRLESYSRGEGAYLFTANDDFFLGPPFVKRLELKPAGDEGAALLAGQIDAGSPGGGASDGARPEVLAPFRADPAFEVIDTGTGNYALGLYWNLAKGGALGDVRFRRACAKAINRPDLVQRLLGGNGQPGFAGFLAADHPFHASAEDYPFDPIVAGRLLEDAGYKSTTPGGIRQGVDGQPLSFKLLVPAQNASLAELVKGALRAVGIDLSVQTVPAFPQIIGPMVQGNFEMAITLIGGPLGDPDYMRGVFSTKLPVSQRPFFRASGYADAELNELADRQGVAFDQGERKRLVSQMQQIIARDIPLLLLYHPTSFRVIRRSVFDQWPGKDDDITTKQALVTGLKATDLKVRPTK